MTKFEILLLGDDSQSFRTMGWVLAYRGFSVKAFGSPEAALEALVKKNYDLVIAKLSREKRDNLEVLKRAKRLNPETKVMLISGSLDMTFPLEAYQIDIDDYIIMPVSASELWRRVQTCLDGSVVDLVPTQAVSPAVSENDEGVWQSWVRNHTVAVAQR
jgi:ATP-dependent Lon protease